jgi:hypothetical protein
MPYVICFSILLSCREAAQIASEDELLQEKTGFVLDQSQLVIAPHAPVMFTGDSFPLSAFLFLPYDKVKNVSQEGEWASGDPDTIRTFTLADHPEAEALRLGTTQITFSYQGLSASSVWTVAQKKLDQVFFPKTEQRLVLSRTATGLIPKNVSFSFIGAFSDGSTEELNTQATWSSSDASILQVGSAGGAFVAKATGTVTVTAAFQGREHILRVTISAVDREVQSLRIAPGSSILPLNTPENLVVEAVYNDQTVENVTSLVQVTPGDSSIVEYVGTNFRLTGKALGSTSLIVSFQGQQLEHPLRVIDPTRSSLDIVADTAFGVAVGTSQSLRAILRMSDGSTENVSSRVTWTSSNPSIVEVSGIESQKGLMIGRRSGSTTVRAAWAGLSRDITMPVSSAIPLSLFVSSTIAGTLPLYLSRDFQATARMSDGTTADVTRAVFWSIESDGGNGYYEMGTPGRFVSNYPGTLRIQASLNGLTASSSLSIGAVAPVLVQITGLATTMSLAAGPRSLTALVTMSDGSTVDRTTQADWTYSIVGSGLSFAGYCENTTGRKGICTPVAQGSFRISVSFQGLTGERTVEVVTP